MHEYLSISVKKRRYDWHIRVIDTQSGKPCHPEGACRVKMEQHIAPAIAEILRWHDKMGGTSPMASESRFACLYYPPDDIIRAYGKDPVYSWDKNPTRNNHE